MKKIFSALLILVLFLFYACETRQHDKWIPAPNPLMTRWSSEIDPDKPWSEYPRPQLVRKEWINLNGLWDYQLLNKGETPGPSSEKILVPYPVESSLSGIADSVGPGHVIWYHRTFELPGEWAGKYVLLNFEAVDWETTVVINGEEVGTHRGGYDPFTFDITNYILPEGANDLVVWVTDPSSDGYQPRGKQVLKPGGIWYTPTSGIWQTVWLEAVNECRIENIFINPLPFENTILLNINTQNAATGDKLRVVILDKGTTIVQGDFIPGEEIKILLDEFKWWSPDSPYLYDLNIKIIREGAIVDEVASYFGMREVHKKIADDSYMRLYLNGGVIFHNGPLDQGFWPDGLYTPPTDEAMKFDIQTTIDLGFNMLRKHVKVENRRFYYWCDKLGIMVWQDMPSTSGYVAPDKADLIRPREETAQFRLELEQMILSKYNHPSIVMWVPFNEGWGQFDTEEIVDFIYELDPNRLVNNTSGWADRGVGDVIDIHHYPDPIAPEAESERASVLGEFGGLGLYVEGHTWEMKNWGYRKMNDSLSLLNKYEQFYTVVWQLMREKGLAAAVYTQTTDVETETNGLMTYDRQRLKMDQSVLKGINTNDYLPAPRFADEEGDGLFSKSYEVNIIGSSGNTYYTLDGSDPSTASNLYEAPFIIDKNTKVRALSMLDGKKSLIIEKQYTLTQIGPPVYLIPFDDRYTGGGIFALVDGKLGGMNFSDGKWQGYRNNGMDVIIDLGSKKDLSRVYANFLVNHEGWIFLPARLELYISDNRSDFELVSQLSNELPESMGEPGIFQLSFEDLNIRARYIRIKAESIGSVPAWHSTAQERSAWFFIDEIIAE